MKRKASAVWNGGLKDGKGAISTDSGVLSRSGGFDGGQHPDDCGR